MTAIQDKKEKFLKKFGEHVKSIRIKKGLTGAELARRCYMDKQNISKLEKGKFNPSLYYLKNICEGLEIELDELLKGVK
jgi:putative transcriptional regulator